MRATAVIKDKNISSGCHHATPTPQFFWNCHYCGKGALCFRFDLAKLFLQGPTMPTLHQKFSFVIVIIVGRGIILLLRFSQVISSGCHHATPTPIFFNCHYCGKGALYFCFELTKVFLQGATCHTCTQFFSELSLLWEGSLCFCFDLAKVFLHDATMPTLYPNFFLNCHYCGKGALCFCFDLAIIFLQGATIPPIHRKCIIIIIIIIRYFWKRALCFCFKLDRVFLQGAAMPSLQQQNFRLLIIVGRGHYVSASA